MADPFTVSVIILSCLIVGFVIGLNTPIIIT